MKIKIDNDLLIRITFLMAAMIVVLQVLKLETVMSRLFYILFVVVAVSWILTVISKMQRNDVLLLFIMLLSAISVLYNSTRYFGAINFEYFKKLIMFFSALMFFQIACKCKMNQETEQFILNINSLVILFLIIMYFTFNEEMYVWNDRNVRYLMFRFTNPNLIGLFLTCMTMIEAARIYEKKWINKLFHGFQVVMLLNFITKTESRNCLLALVIFGAGIFFTIVINKKQYRIGKAMSLFISILPLIFVIIYMLFVKNGAVREIFSFITNEQKTLSSRWEVWTYAVESVRNFPFLGTYNTIIEDIGVSHFHNSHLDVMASYGLIVFCLFCAFLRNIVCCQIDNDKKAFVFQIGFCGVLLFGIGEAAVFSGGLSLFVFAGMLRALAGRKIAADR